ncbi:transglycosylase SLT domain-containing protein [Gluconobacter sp. Dm-44]|uniref:transglycosylase SLT domain-containing protein n=1 Tax=Gluconobacter sp. Dm-44 TaxID=2799805 RepID=UPI001B8CB3A0|nr:transglycosylase SLT domain-containing protein [Gluconobacter sp. Dm-44]MBS1060769.1 transglycosylase SLT domain-containing protein [Gluconobacter sp. Dm-44]
MPNSLQQRVDAAFADASRSKNIDERWLRAIAQTESGGDLNARSKAGAVGLMQIMPDTAKRLGIDPRDPVQAIHGAAQLLDENLKRYGDPVKAMQAYNAGTDEKRWSNPETSAYPGKVFANMATIQKKQQSGSTQDLDDSVYGWGNSSPKTAPVPEATLDDSIYGWGKETPPSSPRPELSRAEKAWTLVNDTVNSAGREIDRTFGVGVPHLVSWATSLGHHMDNPVSRAAHGVGDWVASKEDADEAARKNDYGAPYTDAAGTMLGAGLATALGGRVVRPAAAALDETRAGRIVANALTGDGPSAMKYANNALAAGVQTGLAGGDWKDATALTLGLGAAGKLGSKVISPVADRASAALRRAGDYLDPQGAVTRGTEESPSEIGRPASTSAQKAEEKAQIKAISKVGAFSDPEKAADAIVKAFTSKDGTRLYNAQTPGVFQTLAVRTQDPKMAGLENNQRDLYPDAFRTLDSANDHAYTQHLREVIGTPEQIHNLEAERSAFEEAQRTKAFENEEAVPVGALHATLDSHIAANKGNDPVRQAIIKAKKALQDVTFAKENPSPTHSLWNEPEDPVRWAKPSDLWNVRKAIGYGLQKAASGEDANMRAAAARLSPFMDDLANHIDQGAPGFHDYLEGYSRRSGDIDSLRFLQSRGLTQPSTNAPTGESVNYTALKNLIKQIDKNEVSVATKGTDAVTPEQESRLRTVFRDMQAERTMRDAARSNGSNTFKNAMQQRQKEIRGGHFGSVASTLGGLLGAQEGGLMTGSVTGAALHAGNALLGHALTNRRLTKMEQTDQAVINHLLGH